jgi:hypothetical protein
MDGAVLDAGMARVGIKDKTTIDRKFKYIYMRTIDDLIYWRCIIYRCEGVLEKYWGFHLWFVKPNVKMVKWHGPTRTHREDPLQLFAETEGVHLRATSSGSERPHIGNLSMDHHHSHVCM